ncbi:MAG: hypothetical protein PHO37_17305 [Kiritimatiellae bacterium]|nr:hypothetical protein [Kiritimatiellia bacterium]
MDKKWYSVAAMVMGGLIVGATVEHLRMAAKTPEVKASEPEVIHHVQKVVRTTPDIAQEELVASLKAKVSELNSELAALRKSSEPQPVAMAELPVQDIESRGRESWNDRMERMKEEEPEQYAEMQQRREDFQKRMEQRSTDRRSFLAEVNVANMTPEQQANHTRLLELTDKIDTTMKQLMSGDGESSRDLRREMFESFGELGELYTNERQYLLEETAAAAGYTGSSAALFSEHIQAIIENTTIQPPMMGGGRGGRGGR